MLKRMLEMQSGMSHTQINLEGWPSGDRHIIDSVSLNVLLYNAVEFYL